MISTIIAGSITSPFDLRSVTEKKLSAHHKAGDVPIRRANIYAGVIVSASTPAAKGRFYNAEYEQ